MKESGDDQTVFVTSNFPPAVFCNINSNEPCRILIDFGVAHSEDDIRCPSSNEILPQLVIHSTMACGMMLTNENWQLAHPMTVRAVVDGKTDGDQERSVVVNGKLNQNMVVSVPGFSVSLIPL